MKTKNNTHFSKLLLLAGLLVLAGSKGWGQRSITAIGTAVTESFDGLANTGTSIAWSNNSTLTGWYTATDINSTIANYGTNTGSTTTAGLYSFGSTSATDRAFGFSPSDGFTGTQPNGRGYIGWRLKNNTATAVGIGTIRVVWTGEQWRRVSTTTSQVIKLSYQIGTTVTSVTTGEFILTASQFSSPINTTGTASALNGNTAANRTASITIDINVNIPYGSEIMLRWEDANDPANHFLAIDDISVTATKQSQSISFGTLPSRPFVDGQTFSLSATATSGLGVTFASSNPSIVSVSGSTATVHGGGQVTITASQAGNGTYAPAIDVPQEQIIVPAAPVATAATNVTTGGFTANWNPPSGGASEYWFYYDTDIAFSNNFEAASSGSELFFKNSGLLPNTTYYYRVRAKAGAEYSAYSNIITVSTPVGIQTSNIAQTINGFTSTTLIWQNGNAGYRIVFLREGTGVACPNPINDVDYEPSSDWSVKGTELGSGFYCIFNGTASTVDLTELTPGVYTVEAFEFDQIAPGTSSAKYLTIAGANNPINYSTWTTTTFTNTTPGQSTPEDWTTAARWDHATVPTAAMHSAVLVYIDGNCQITTTTASNNLTINAAHSNISPKLTINPAKSLTVSGTLSNNAGTSGLVIKSTAAGTGQLMHNNSGINATVERFATGLNDGVMNRYHLVSVPINTNISPLYSEVFLWSYLARYDESASKWYQMNTPTDNTIYTGLGYLTYDPTDATETYIFRGKLNYNDVPAQLTYTEKTKGWNLIGNPYPSTLDWDAITGKTSIGNAIYLWDQVNHRYATYTTDIGGTNGGTQYIAPGQAFFVRTTDADAALTINNTARTLTAATFLKSTEQSPTDVLHLTAKINNMSDEMLVHFNPSATDLFDGAYDAYKLTSLAGAAVPGIYSVDANGTKYSINSLPFHSPEVAVDVVFSIGVDGVATFTASGLESFAQHTGLSIYLKDTKTNQEISLQTTPEYTFNYLSSDDPKRFKIRFAESLTGIGEKKSKALKCNVYAADKNLTIQYNELQSKKGYAYILDAQGRTVKTVLLDGSGSQQIQLPVATGVYLVKLLFSDFTETHKIAIR